LINQVAIVVLSGIVKTVRDKLGEMHTFVDTTLAKIRGIFNGIMFGIAMDIQPVIEAINGILKAAQDLYNWLTGHVFNFQLPDIPGVSTNGTNTVSRPAQPAYGTSSSSVSYGAPVFNYSPT